MFDFVAQSKIEKIAISVKTLKLSQNKFNSNQLDEDKKFPASIYKEIIKALAKLYDGEETKKKVI